MTEEKSRYKKQTRNYEELVGMTYNYLTVLEILPRARDKYGALERPRCKVRCVCGKVKEMRIYDVINNTIVSCGCKRGAKGADKNVEIPMSVVEALEAKYYCKYTTNSCVRSKKLHLCCFECDRYDSCSVACQSSPKGCGARLRTKDDEGTDNYD